MKTLSLKLVDTHCHIEQSEFDTDRRQVIARALELGVAMISSAIAIQEYEKLLTIADEFETVHASLGLDPTSFASVEQALVKIRENKSRIIAIGETGLDHYLIRDHDDRRLQEQAIREIIVLAAEFGLPIQIHSRSAGRKAVEVLTNAEAGNVHMHAFDGKASIARSASRDLGYYFSIPPSVVRSPQKQKLVKAVDIERLLLETDSPVLGPEKGVRNEPSNVLIALQEVSRMLRRDEEELREIILENTLRLYDGIGHR